MHIMAAMQLIGEAGEMQIPDATLADISNMAARGCRQFLLDPGAPPNHRVDAPSSIRLWTNEARIEPKIKVAVMPSAHSVGMSSSQSG
jgi:hypothetical protein